MERKRSVKQLVAAGGLVYRRRNGGIEVVACDRDSPHLRALPKGTPGPGETREQTALREVGEETGLDVEIEGFIQAIHYWFSPKEERRRYHKSVYFYLMRPRGGDVSGHDAEFDNVLWLSADEALKTLTYENEVKVVQKALSMVAQRPGV
jgi:8-oxo-dGTP pyrophosphatase MutT (NUDIX family)